MKGRTSLVLLVCIVLLGAFIWMQETWHTSGPSKEAMRLRLFDLDAATLVSLQFRGTNGLVRCVGEYGEWNVVGEDSSVGRADVALLFRLVSGLNSLGKGTTITGDQLEIRGFGDSEYGFDAPVAEITAVDGQGRHQWLVGRNSPLGKMVYVKHAGSAGIFTVSDRLLALLPKDPGQLRDRSLFGGDAAGVRRVEIRGTGGFVQLGKDAVSGWSVQQPFVAKADPKEVEAYLGQLHQLRVVEFLADNVSDFSVYGLHGETRQISLGGADGTSRMLVIGDAIPDRAGLVYARRADDTSVFALKAEVLGLLDVPAPRFRDASVMALPSDAVTGISVRHGSEWLSLALASNGTWNVETPVAWPADDRVVADLLDAWSRAVIIQFNVQTNGSAPEWVFEFSSASLGRTNRIEVLEGSGKKDGLFIRRDDDPSVYQINLVDVLPRVADPLFFKDKVIWQLGKGDIQRIASLRAGRPRQTIQRLDDGTFAVAETNGNVRVDAVASAKMVDNLAALQTRDYITYNPHGLEVYGLDKPFLELHLALKGTNQLGRVLLVGSETPDGYCSMVQGRDVVFYLEAALVKDLSADLVVLQEGEPAVLP